ncbi:MAG: OmpA family protein [Candidatus Cloacimonadaceae bacterium]
MKPMVLITMLLLALFTFSNIYAQARTNWGYGIYGGAARGDNAGEDETWVPTGRAFIQLGIARQFMTQIGLSYMPLKTQDNPVNPLKAYETQIAMADIRFLFSPIQMSVISPYIYTGMGVAKDVKDGNSHFCPVFPMGLGLQARLGDRVSLDLHGGYNVSSDRLDGLTRASNDMNSLTNARNDAFYNVMFGVSVNSPFGRKADKPLDSDKDGLTDEDEINKYNTNPLKADTDGDGLNDWDEIMVYKTDPNKADTDGDGLSDYDEVKVHLTNPLKIDTDGGGMIDGAEIKAGKNPLDPKDDVVEDLNKLDTDGDGLSDYDEINKYRTDPKKADTDGDGLSDGDEVLKYRTDPLKADTDGDGLNDYEEVMVYKTDPNKADSDSDGLTDFAEVKTHRTDPTNIDTDGGGMNDGAEIKAGRNPLDPSDDLFDLKKDVKLVLTGINFATGSSTILSNSAVTLQKVYESLQANSDVSVLITGHTDSVGSDADNQALSMRRANSVKTWLVNKGISSSRIQVAGKGESEPIASNETLDGRAQNRRIEISAIN